MTMTTDEELTLNDINDKVQQYHAEITKMQEEILAGDEDINPDTAYSKSFIAFTLAMIAGIDTALESLFSRDPIYKFNRFLKEKKDNDE